MMDDVYIAPYDAAWPAMFAAEAARLRAVLPAELVVGIEHFGSTAIPGMAAKPVIDILIAVTSLARAKQEIVELVRSLDYVYWEDNPSPDRMFFVKGMPPYGTGRTHHVHVCEQDGEMWRRLAFRDHLRADADEAHRYEALKRALAAQYAMDRERYTAAKSAYIEEVYRKLGLGEG